MELDQRVKLARLIVALDEDDRDAVVSAYVDMGVRTKRMGEENHTRGTREGEREVGNQWQNAPIIYAW